MKIAALTTMMLLSSSLAYCGSEPATGGNRVTVCLSSGKAPGITVERAKILASGMFNQISVSIEWQPWSRKCPTEAIVVKLTEQTPSSLRPGAFAYALPYEGVHIQVFYDRISDAFSRSMLEIVLAHVLVHEITHILEGIPRHSEQGVMKAKWRSDDIYRMQKKPLEFAPEDVDLIHRGLAERRNLPMVAMNTDQTRQSTNR